MGHRAEALISGRGVTNERMKYSNARFGTDDDHRERRHRTDLRTGNATRETDRVASLVYQPPSCSKDIFFYAAALHVALNEARRAELLRRVQDMRAKQSTAQRIEWHMESSPSESAQVSLGDELVWRRAGKITRNVRP